MAHDEPAGAGVRDGDQFEQRFMSLGSAMHRRDLECALGRSPPLNPDYRPSFPFPSMFPRARALPIRTGGTCAGA